MKTTLKTVLVALVAAISFTASYAQKNNVSSAERIAKKKEANFDEARQLIQQALANPETKDEAKTYYVAGFIEENNFTQENMKQVVGETPDRAVMNKALLEMYRYYLQAKEIDNQPNQKGKVRPRYTKDILKAFENNLLYFINAGGYYLEVQNYDEALKAFKAFRDIKQMPEFQGGPLAVADSNSMMVDFFAVVTAYQADKKELAIELAEKIQDVPYRQNDLLQVLSQTQLEVGDTTAYVATMNKGLELFPDEAYYSVNLINTYIGQGKDELAIKTLETAIERSPSNVQLYDVMGKLHENAGREDEALSYFKKALEIDPEYGEANYDLGRVYYNKAVTLKSGENIDKESDAKATEYFHLALPYLEKAYEKDPDQTYYLLGNIYYQLQMNDKYKEIMDKHQ